MAETRSTCCYCGVGCGLIIEHEAGRITGVRGDPEHPANFGRLCTKGAPLHLSAAPETLAARAPYPELRTEHGAPASPLSREDTAQPPEPTPTLAHGNATPAAFRSNFTN